MGRHPMDEKRVFSPIAKKQISTAERQTNASGKSQPNTSFLQVYLGNISRSCVDNSYVIAADDTLLKEVNHPCLSHFTQ